jgi:polyisoprenoid-binding protein YceI
MRKIKNNAFVLFMLFAFITVHTSAQQVFEINSSNSNMTVKGTSSLHDWQMEATKFTAITKLEIEDEQVTEILNVSFSTPVKNLSSDKWIMDKNAHEALKEDDYPKISFSLKNDTDINFQDKKVTIPGNLTVAGSTQLVSVICSYNFISPRQLKASGNADLKMSSFGIDPPTAMLGTLKTDDDITVEFELEFILESSSSAEVLP